MPYRFHRNLALPEILALTEELIVALPLFGLHETSDSFQKHGGLREGETVWIQHNDHSKFRDLDQELPNTFRILRTIAKEIVLEPNFGRAYIHRLPAERRIHPHVDNFDYHKLIDRYHVYLDIPEKVTIRHNGPTIEPNTIIQFDHESEHMYINNSDEALYFMVFDIYK